MSPQRISVVVPVYDEHENIQPCLRGLWKALEHLEHEILVCYDFDGDSTLSAIATMPDRPPSVRLVKNDLGRGAANALRAGFAAATGDVVVTTMADLSDPPEVIPALAAKLRAEGVAVVSGSRYMPGGSQDGGPWFKGLCSRASSLAMQWLAGIGTRDATTNFRAYDREFLRRTPVESTAGFEVALELTVKAHLSGAGVAEVPSRWTDRTAGESRFRMWKWAPHYLRWYWEAMAAPAFVWMVLGVLFLAALAFVGTYAGAVPQRDDLEWANVIAPGQWPSAEWWWSPFNEHRIPLPRVFFLALAWTTGDIRSGMFFDVLVLAGLASAMVLAARRLRGRTSYADACFPLLWLSVGNAENLLMMHQVSLVVPTAITSLLLLFVCTDPRPPALGRSLGIGLCVLGLPLCGAPGLTVAPPLLLWCLYAGRRAQSGSGGSGGSGGTPSQRAAGRVLFAAAGLTAALLVFYFVDFDNPARTAYLLEPLGVLRQAWMFLSLGFGPAAREAWPVSGWLCGALLTAVLLILGQVLVRRPAERLRALGILAVGAGIFSMAVSTGIARGNQDPFAGFALRYVTLPTPWLCCAALTFALYPPRAVGRFLGVTIFSATLLACMENARIGVEFGRRRAEQDFQFRDAIRRGFTVRELAITFWQDYYGNPQDLEDRLERLRLARFGPMADAQPTIEALPIPMFEAQPWLVTTLKAGPRKLEDQSVYLVPPECELHFPLPYGKRRMEARFGLYPLAYEFTPEGGVRFSLEFLSVGREPRILHERVLDTARRSEDRGTHSFVVDLPPGAEGALVLRTAFVGTARDERAFGYWTAVAIR